MTLFSDEVCELIEAKVGYEFKDKGVLRNAFIHRSYFNEHKEEVKESNERLEFLGDAVLGLIVSKYLFEAKPECEEGVLSHLRSRLVDAPACAFYSQALGLNEFALLGKGEKLNDGKGRESILADLFEAMMGALFLDGGFEVAGRFFLEKCLPFVEQFLKEPLRNYKAELQEFIQKNYKQAPTYRTLKEVGPDHNKQFLVAAYVDEKLLGEGEGSSKKQAEQNAAQVALQNLEEK